MYVWRICEVATNKYKIEKVFLVKIVKKQEIFQNIERFD